MLPVEITSCNQHNQRAFVSFFFFFFRREEKRQTQGTMLLLPRRMMASFPKSFSICLSVSRRALEVEFATGVLTVSAPIVSSPAAAAAALAVSFQGLLSVSHPHSGVLSLFSQTSLGLLGQESQRRLHRHCPNLFFFFEGVTNIQHGWQGPGEEGKGLTGRRKEAESC